MATLHTINFEHNKRFIVSPDGDSVVLGCRLLWDDEWTTTSDLKLDPITARALGSALYLTAERMEKGSV